MEPDDTRALVFVEVAGDGVADHFLEMSFVVGRGENGMAQSAGGDTTFGSGFDEKNEFVYGLFRL